MFSRSQPPWPGGRIGLDAGLKIFEHISHVCVHVHYAENPPWHRHDSLGFFLGGIVIVYQ